MPDDLKHLHPEDRIKKLKELEKKRKEEIAKAQEEIKKSKQDIKKSEEELLMERQQKEKEFLAIMEKLEKERVEKKKGKEETEDNSDETNETNKSALSETSSKLESQLHHHHHHHHQPQQSDANNLENQLRQEQVSLQQQNSVYALSKEPMQELYKEMNTLYKAVEDKGYLSQEEEKKVRYLASAVEEKIKAHDEGNYSFTDKVAQAADITQKIGSKLKKMYHS